MAPRTAKAKKTADVKVSESEVPAKGKGKEKNIPEPIVDEDEDNVPVVEKKTKRGKKVTEGKQTNGDGVPAAKKGKKKNEVETNSEELASNDDNSEDAESIPTEENEDDADTNEHSEEEQAVPAGRGRKKPTKKEAAPAKLKETKGKKNVKQNETDTKKELGEDKPKGRGRGRKAKPKPEVEAEAEEMSDNVEEEPKPAAKGRKKAQAKSSKEKTPDSETEESQEEQKDIDEPEEEPEPKKSGRGKKNVGKKAQAKVEAEDVGEDIKEEPASKKRKVTKKDIKEKGESKDEDDMEEDAPEPKPAKGKRGAKKAVEKATEAEEEVQDTGEPTTKRRRKQADDKAATEDTKKKAPSKTKSATDYDSIDFSNSSVNSQGKEWNFKIASWNVDGIRAWLGKGGLDYIKYEKPDILCLQELKCAKEKLPEEITNLPGYHAYWLCSDKDGYAGVGIYTTKLAMNVQYGLQDEDLDTEGRIITAEYEHFYLICTYVPNSGRKLVTLPKRLKWNEEFSKHVKSLDKKKPVIICGDMNVSHNEIDLTNPKTNRKNAGFTDEERSGMTELLGEGFVDTFRHLYPNKTGAYTFWTYMFNSRAKNVGWRLDYFIVSQRLLPTVCDSVIQEKVYGSDHCPISLFLHLSTADKPKE
ncbi:uncharacterized protein Rrp1 [Epargyreus clarus]|uniref:uncharacterized protein Rrp1 n=1 Tax=Epargyreus clarus TaxID=520877 RepID=UPI003C309760